MKMGHRILADISLTPSEKNARLSLIFALEIKFFNVNFDGTYWSFDKNSGMIEPSNNNDEIMKRMGNVETVRINPPIKGPIRAIIKEVVYQTLTSWALCFLSEDFEKSMWKDIQNIAAEVPSRIAANGNSEGFVFRIVSKNNVNIRIGMEISIECLNPILEDSFAPIGVKRAKKLEYIR